MFATEPPGSRSPGLFFMICNFYIDGYNWYHRLDAYYKSTGENYKWLNYRSLCKWIIHTHPGNKIGHIYFCTALPPELNKEKYKGTSERFTTYTNALRHYGIEIVQGYFKTKRTVFQELVEGRKVKVERITVEEKQTDSNIVAYSVRDAFLNKFDKAFILSADSDIVPAVRVIKETESLDKKEIVVVPPPFRKEDRLFKDRRMGKNYFPMHRIDNFIEYTKNKAVKVHFEDLKYHLLPEKITDKSEKVITMPEEYRIVL